MWEVEVRQQEVFWGTHPPASTTVNDSAKSFLLLMGARMRARGRGLDLAKGGVRG